MRLSSVYYLFYLLIFSFVFTGCSQNKNGRDGIDPLDQNKASAKIEDSFTAKQLILADTQAAVTNASKNTQVPAKQATNADADADANATTSLTTDLSVDKAHVVIQKAALQKEFLLSVNLLVQTPTPQFSALQSRVVSFILRDQKVYLLDVTNNNRVSGSTNIPQSLLIAEFKILKQTDKELEIDFNLGMSQIFVSRDMFASDLAKNTSAEYKLPLLQTRLSYLDEVRLDNSALFIRQIAQVVVGGKDAAPFEVRYQIKPYLPDPSFIPVKSPGFDKVGYFEANPVLLNDGSTQIYTKKWNEKKPIRLAISANTPEKYRQTIKKALLYWSKILGNKAIEVTQLEDKTLTAPQFDLNIVQWVEWDLAGFAYADSHADPRSGEVTSAQIFISSFFAKQPVAQQLKLVKSSVSPTGSIGLSGFKSARACNRDLTNEFTQREISLELSPEAADKAIRDYIYLVISHEFGHVLGLRHNFAGSLAANYDFKDRKELILSYYKNMKAPEGIVASNSVMEYTPFEESTWIGDQSINNPKALTYDEMAIKYLYFKTPLPTADRPLFCTDSELTVFADCNKRDAGRSVVSAASGAYQFGLDSVAANLINQFINESKITPDLASKLVPIPAVSLDAKTTAAEIGENFAKLISLMKEKTYFIAVYSQYLPILDTMRSEITASEKDYLQKEFIRLGGLENLAKEIPDNFDTELVSKFLKLLDDPSYNFGDLSTGGKYSFTTDEKEIMKKQVALFATQLKKELILNQIETLSAKGTTWADSDLTFELSQLLQERFSKYALSKTAEKITSEITLKDTTKKQVELPLYQYPENIRLAAATLLSGGHSAVDWGYVEKQTAANLLEADLLLLGDPKKIDMHLQDRNVIQWYLNNKKIKDAMPE